MDSRKALSRVSNEYSFQIITNNCRVMNPIRFISSINNTIFKVFPP